ncbi:polysaccharide deacetylase family protein [Mesorhizobium sp. 1M-11]|uniref:polysaccharide deacetylase family protein n=1 Tax=Mesorhizobium sp. 1M-11 TaxID=1529006 RepID=UPI0006C7611F|nr:polysaccharide deacetylase family protein [Mesorhizobium sp. 1M-11]
MSLKGSAKRFLKHGAIRAGLEGVALTRAGALWPAAAGRGVIFTLHHVRPARRGGFDPIATLSVTPEFLDEAIRVCTETGLTPVALDDLPRLLADPRDKRRFAAFTLDDGLRDNAQHAAPVFRRHGVPYTIFIARGFVERTRSMWWETAKVLTRSKDRFEFDFGTGQETVTTKTVTQKQDAYERIVHFVHSSNEDAAVAEIERAARSRMIDPLAIVDQLVMTADELRVLSADPLVRFGAHTQTHIAMARVDEARLAEEITGSMDAVEAYVGYRPTTFAYPYGTKVAVSPREFDAVKKAGIKLAVTTRPGMLTADSFDQPTELPRVSLNGHYQRRRYVKALLTGIPFRLF